MAPEVEGDPHRNCRRDEGVESEEVRGTRQGGSQQVGSAVGCSDGVHEYVDLSEAGEGYLDHSGHLGVLAQVGRDLEHPVRFGVFHLMRKGVDELLELGRDLQGSAVAHGDDVIGGGEAPAERGADLARPPVRRTTLRSGAEGLHDVFGRRTGFRRTGAGIA